MTATQPNVLVNYYELLGLPPTADADAIEKKIKADLRTYSRRAGSPDLAKRQEAELRVQHLGAARRILLDARKRAEYDRQLSAQRAEPAQPIAPSGNQDWLTEAEELLARGDYHSAAYAAREATHVQGNSPRAWNLRGRANAGLGNLNDAIYEVRQAAQLDPNNAQYHFDVGGVCEQLELWNDALAAYETAARLDPSDPVYRLSVAGVYVQNDLPDKALPIVEEVHRRLPEDEFVNNALAETLSSMAEHVPAHRRGDTYMITSASEIEKMESLLGRARGLRHLDKDTVAELDRVQEYIDSCKKKVYSPPPFLARHYERSPINRYNAFIAPPVLLLISIAVMGNDPGPGSLMLLFTIGFTVLTYYVFWVPAWKRNKRSLAR